MSKKGYYTSLKLNTKLPAINVGPFGRIKVIQFTAVSDDFNPLYLDDEAAQKADYNGMLVPNTLISATIEQALFGFVSNCTILRVETEFQKIIWPSTHLKIQGVVVNCIKDNGMHRIVWEIWAEDNHQSIAYKSLVTTLVFKNAAEEKALKTPYPVPPNEYVQERLKTLVVPCSKLR